MVKEIFALKQELVVLMREGILKVFGEVGIEWGEHVGDCQSVLELSGLICPENLHWQLGRRCWAWYRGRKLTYK